MDLIPQITLHLFERDWEWRYDFQTIFTFDRQMDKTLLLKRWGDLRSEDWTALTWAGIYRHDETLTFERFIKEGSPLELGGEIAKVMDAILTAVMDRGKVAQSDPTIPRPKKPKGGTG